MPDTALPEIKRADYRPPAFLIDDVDLHFALDPAATIVRSRLSVRRNPAYGEAAAPLQLDGEALELVSVRLNGEALGANRYRLAADGSLTIPEMPDRAVLEIETRINPAENTELSGLYVSGDSFFTQCEAQGFRRITYFPDRPDVMARFSVTLVADQARAPVLLSNGNPGETGTLEGGLHYARWVAFLSVRAGGGCAGGGARPVRHPLRSHGAARDLGARGRPGSLRARDAFAEDIDGVGRDGLWPRI
jgi:aminopeptidase N